MCVVVCTAVYVAAYAAACVAVNAAVYFVLCAVLCAALCVQRVLLLAAGGVLQCMLQHARGFFKPLLIASRALQ